MPQMAPMNWLTLYFMFIFIFMFMIIINYFTFLYTPKNKITFKMKKNSTNWKW